MLILFFTEPVEAPYALGFKYFLLLFTLNKMIWGLIGEALRRTLLNSILISLSRTPVGNSDLTSAVPPVLIWSSLYGGASLCEVRTGVDWEWGTLCVPPRHHVCTDSQDGLVEHAPRDRSCQFGSRGAQGLTGNTADTPWSPHTLYHLVCCYRHLLWPILPVGTLSHSHPHAMYLSSICYLSIIYLSIICLSVIFLPIIYL